jgi:hypothetical protein
VVEGVEQGQSLVEELLRFPILRGYGVVMIAQTLHQCGLASRSGSGMISKDGIAKEEEQGDAEVSHGFSPPESGNYLGQEGCPNTGQTRLEVTGSYGAWLFDLRQLRHLEVGVEVEDVLAHIEPAAEHPHA